MLLYGISSLTYIAVNVLVSGSICSSSVYTQLRHRYTCSFIISIILCVRTIIQIIMVAIDHVLFTHEAPIQRMRKVG